jgi:hypothetical protein
MKAWWTDSLVKVFPDDQPDSEAGLGLAHAARNEVVSLQLVVLADRTRGGVTVDALPATNDQGSLPAPRWRAVGYVPLKKNTTHTPEEELVRKAPGLFPDPLLELGSLALGPGRAQPVWLTLHVPPEAKPGVYQGTVRLADGGDLVELPYAIHVHAAALSDERTLLVTNWFWADDRVTTLMGAGPAFSDSWWRMVEGFLRNQWAHRQNVFWMRPLEWLCEYSVQAGHLKIDFSRFDRWVRLLSSVGDRFWMEGPFLTVRDGYDAALEVPVPVVAGERVEVRRLRCDDPRVEPFLRQFLREYSRHIAARGLAGQVFVHIGDEPHGAQMPDYIRIADLARKYAPELPVIEALDVGGSDYEVFDRCVDIWVPQLGRFDAQVELLRAHRAAGKQAWLYTCLFPTGRYPNRFVDFSLLKTRLLHWINYRWDLPGYLHWGWNAWTPRPFLELEPEWNDGFTLPPGDGYLVYPGRGAVLDSIRSEQMLEGIQDYELLMALHRKRPEMAQAIAAETIPSFTDYVREPRAFRRLRERLLVELSA